MAGGRPSAIPCAASRPKLYYILGRLEVDAPEREQLRMKLVEIANDPADNRSLTEVSSVLGARKNFLIYWFRDLCATVTTKHRKEKQRQVEVKWEIEAQRVRDEIAKLCNERIYPSRKKVEAAISPLSLHNQRLRSVYQVATRKLKQVG